MTGESPNPHSDGFTLVEALVASLLFLLIVLGIAPLFTTAAVQSAAGRMATEGSNLARSRAEEMERLGFDSPQLSVESGREKRIVEHWEPEHREWLPGLPAGTSPWLRTTVVRQYPVAALTDGTLDPSEAAPATTAPGTVYLKEIRVTVRPGGRGLN